MKEIPEYTITQPIPSGLVRYAAPKMIPGIIPIPHFFWVMVNQPAMIPVDINNIYNASVKTPVLVNARKGENTQNIAENIAVF